LKAKKSFGQHFLKNEFITQNIAESIDLTSEYPRVLEIGPGMGMLSKYLMKGNYDLKLCEADKDMVAYLLANLAVKESQIIFQDFMKVDLKKLFDGNQFIIIGNFPYNISSQIIFKMLDDIELVPQLVGMFQKEMADRVVAKHGSKTYGIISVLAQAYYDCELLFNVDRMEFDPPPKVQSAVIKMNRKADLNLGCDPILFKKIVKLSFGQRRKMLRNTLKNMVKDESMLLLPLFSLRPETLSVQQFVELTNMLV
jgi:16S rRNA (adenine1518-N6/adenine1519-N6)-dimethyltransferase